MADLISKTFDAAKQGAVNAAFQTLQLEMDFTINLTPGLRSAIYKAGNFHKGLVLKARDVVGDYPQILPPSFDQAEFERDVALFVNIEPLLRKLKVLTQAVEDTYMAAGHDSLAAALEVYALVQTASKNFPGLEEVAREMKEFFPHTKKAALPAEPENN